MTGCGVRALYVLPDCALQQLSGEEECRETTTTRSTRIWCGLPVYMREAHWSLLSAYVMPLVRNRVLAIQTQPAPRGETVRFHKPADGVCRLVQRD